MKESAQEPHVPDWRKVTTPLGRLIVYRDLQHANVGRIWVRAWANYRAQNPTAKGGYADFATHLGITRPLRLDSVSGVLKRKRSFSNGISQAVFEHVQRGTLPKDPAKLAALYVLAGYPWE